MQQLQRDLPIKYTLCFDQYSAQMAGPLHRGKFQEIISVVLGKNDQLQIICLCLGCLLEKIYELILSLQLLFIHFNQAQNSTIEHIYMNFKQSVNLIKMTQDSNRKVKIQEQLTEAFGIERGWRQGDALSTTMFNTVLGMVNTETN